MPLRFTVLASGSAGNASLLAADGFGLLLDVGLGPRLLAGRLAAAGAAWQDVHAAILTHTHSDHWRDRTLTHLRRRGVPLYCHSDHAPGLSAFGTAFEGLWADGLVRFYSAGQDFEVGPGLRCRPVPLRHDGGPTFGFRIEGSPDLFGPAAALGYAADLGSWTDAVADEFTDVDLLALEFNHDVGLERSSGRSPYLIARVLGDRGHLSNVQAAELVRQVLSRSRPGRLRQLILLHLSRDCNRPELALTAARDALSECPARVGLHAAEQDRGSPTFLVGGAAASPRSARASRSAGRSRRTAAASPWLPGLEC